MFQPVSSLGYQLLEPTAQAIVVVDPSRLAPHEVTAKWGKRVAAAVDDDPANVRDVVRDLLANPQIRIIVFDGPTRNRDVWEDFRYGPMPDWKIDQEHLTLVRQYVDLFDDDFFIKGPMQPFWPLRIRYTE